MFSRHLLREELFTRINVPADGSCLFWAAALAYLIPVKYNDNVFKERFERLFGSSNPTELKQVQVSIKAYDPSSNSMDIRNNEALKKLVTEKFRNRIIDEISSHQSQFDESITVNDFLHSKNEDYVIGGTFQEKFRNEFSAEISQYNIDINKLKPDTLNEAAIQIIDNELDKIPDENKVKKFKFETYVECMGDSKAWGGNHEIQAMSQVLHSNILVFSDGTKHSISYDNSNDQIQLFNNGESHYNFGLIRAQMLIEAIKNNKQQEAKTYINIGIDNINYQDSDSWTPLHFAAQYGNTEIAQLLLAQGTRTDVKNRLNQTPLDVASLFERNSVVEILNRQSHVGTSGQQASIGQSSFQQQPQQKRPGSDSGEVDQKKPRIATAQVSRGVKRPYDAEEVSQAKKQKTGQDYPKGGLVHSLHGNTYQLKLLMLFLKRGLDEKYSFRLATEWDAAEKFDDLVFQYDRGKEKVWRFLQAKHKDKDNESKRITDSELLKEVDVQDNDFSLQKYFISYRKIKQNTHFRSGILEDFIIATNIDLLDDIKVNFERVTDTDRLLDARVEGKDSARYKFKDSNNNLKSQVTKIFESTSDLSRLARKLAKCVIEGKPINLKNLLFRSYHGALKNENIIDTENKKLHSDFVDNNNLSQPAKEFRRIFQEEASKIKKLPQGDANIWNEVSGKILNLPNSFGKIFQLNTDPQITDTEEFAKVVANLISQQDKAISIKKETTKTGIIKDNIDKLAGHVLIFEGEGKNKKIKFSSAFLDAADTSLLGNLQDFKNILKAELNSKNINFNQLGQYEFKINGFKTCEEGQQYLQNALPNDVVTDAEISEFFEKLVFAVNQPNEIELEGIIKDEIRKEFNTIDSKNVYSRYLKKTLNWMKEKEGRFLSHEDVKAFFEKVKQEILGTIWFNVKDPVRLFTGREEELARLHGAVQYSPTGAVVSHMTSVSGLGGIGKSELARKYAYDHEQDYDGNIIWINAEKHETLEGSFFELARDNRLDIPTKDKNGKEKRVESIVKEIYGFFAKRKSLFIFDNAEKNNDLNKFLPLRSLTPGSNKPYVLITSRDGEWEAGIEVISLDKLKLEDAIALIKKGLSILQEDKSQDQEIEWLVVKLQRFPLAIQQAVAYIEDQRVMGEFSIVDYLKEYEKKTKDLLNSEVFKGIDNDYAKTTFTTWKITIDKIASNEEYGKLALKILNVIAYFAPENINREMFLSLAGGDEERLRSAVRLLVKHSMVSGEQKQGVLSIHRLVQEVTRLELKEQNKEEDVIEKAFNLLKESFSYGKGISEDYVKKQQLLPHLLSHLEAYLSHIDNWLARKPEDKQRIEKDYLENLLTWMSDGYSGAGNPMRQKELFERALAIQEKHYGPDHFEVARTLGNLGNAYRALGDPQKQKELLERALPIFEKHFDPEHFEVAMALEILGDAYGALGDPKKQKELLERALSIFEKHFSLNHFAVARTLGNLANTYEILGNLQKQKELLERALPIFEKYFGHYGHNRLQVAGTLVMLGSTYGALGDFQKKKELFEQALPIFEKHYGPDHFEVARTLGNLGNAYRALGDFQKQKELLERALPIFEKHYGPDHFEVARTLGNLGNAYRALGDPQKQKELLERALVIKEKHFGLDHPETLGTRRDIAVVLDKQGKYDEALQACQEVLDIQKQPNVLGPDHPETLGTRNNMAGVLVNQGKYDEALQAYQEVLDIQKQPNVCIRSEMWLRKKISDKIY